MSDHEKNRANAEAKAAVARSSGPLSRHDVALQRYLGAMQYVSQGQHGDDEWSAPVFVPPDSVPTTADTVPIVEPHSGADAQQRIDMVVAGYDGSSHARRATAWAAAEAERRHAVLRLVYAYSLPVAGYAGYSMAPHDLGHVLRAEGTKMLRDVAGGIRKEHPQLDVQTRLFQGDAVVALRRESRHARLTVVGSRGNGRVSGVLLGSVAMAVTAHGTAPVAIIPAEGPGWDDDGSVVVGVDGSATGEAAIRFAFEQAAVRGSALTAVRVWNPSRSTAADHPVLEAVDPEQGERAMLSELLAGWREKYPDVPVEQQVVRGRATSALLGFARSAQVLVVGSRGRGGFKGMLLGSTSHSLISHAVCPVVVVRPDSLD